MEKEEQLKQEIRQLTALAVSSLAPTSNVSAEAKGMDNLSLEAGMTYIGSQLQTAENTISAVWHSYIKVQTNPTKITYPHKYDLKTDADRQAEAKELKELHQAVPSKTFQKAVSKMIVRTLFGPAIDISALNTIDKEIDDSPVPSADPEVLQKDHEAGFVSDKTASIGRGYDDNEYKQAQKDHADRLARIAAAQTPVGDLASRGVDKTGGSDNPDTEKKLSQNADNADDGARAVRGDE